jgi:YidC/Oxa1 family membrane protein insertase
MTQTRTFLILAWLMVATLLWMEWGKERDAAAAPAPAIPTATQVVGTATPRVPVANVPGAAPVATPVAAAALPVVRLRNDVLALELNGRDVTRAELLRYKQARDTGSPPVVLFDADPARHFAAHSAWRGSDGRELVLQPEGSARDIVLADGAKAVEARFVATTPTGVQLRRTFTLPRGSYALRVRDELANTGSGTWAGDVERRLERVPPVVKSGMTNPEAFSLNGAAWWSPEEKYEKRKYPKFVEDGPLNLEVTGGWIGLSQHYFLAAWIPQKDQGALYSLGANGPLYRVDARGPHVTLGPGQQIGSDATLWVGPKLADQLEATAPGLERAMDYGYFTPLSQPIHWLLTQLHKLTHNWGWAIVLLVVAHQAGAVPAVGRAVQVDGQDAQVPAAHRAAQGALRRRQAEVPDGDAGAVQEGKDQPGRRLPADPDPDAGVPRPVLRAAGRRWNCARRRGSWAGSTTSPRATRTSSCRSSTARSCG